MTEIFPKEIIPKPLIKRPFWQNFLFYFSIFLLMAVAFAYFILNNLFKEGIQTFNDLDKKLAELKTAEEKNLEREILNYQKKIKDFSILIDNHSASSNFFTLLEKLSHPQVQFFSIELMPGESRVSLSGQAENFPVLGQQLIIFQKEKGIKALELSKVSLTEEKKVKFELSLSLRPEIFKF